MLEVVKLLTEKGKTISTMESCTGGALVNEITNVPGASEVIKFSAVTYSNDFKIKMGVSAEIIEKYTVYSMETARAMAKAITDFTGSDYGIGITGKLNKVDPYNKTGNDNEVFVGIYDKQINKYYELNIMVTSDSRPVSKKEIVSKTTEMLLNILKNS